MSAFERPFGHFVRVLVDLDLTKDLLYKILVERVGFVFFVNIEYERIPEFCNFRSCIGHSTNSCKKKGNKENKEENKNSKDDPKAPKQVEIVDVNAHMEKVVNINPAPKDNQAQDVEHGTDGRPSNVVLQPLRDLTIKEQLVRGETSNGNQHSNGNMVNNMSAKFVHIPTSEEDGSSESEYIYATHFVEDVPENQIDETHRRKITDFLQDSWDNMAEADKLEDNGVNLLQDKEF